MPRPFEKIAILRFDDLSGDSKLAWISTAAARILADEIGAAPRMVAVAVGTVSDGYLSGATRLVHGYFDGPTSFHIAIEDLATHKMVATEDLHSGLLASMDQTSHLITPEAKPFSTSQEESALAWGQGNYEEAVAKDPGFSAAWLGWIQQLMGQGQNAKALDLTQRALSSQPALRSPLDRAQIELLAAILKNDAPGRLKALDGLAHLAVFDAQAWRTLAEAQMNARNFTESAAAYKQLLQLEPQNADARNLLGYAQGFAGDLDSAQQTFALYGQMPNQLANSLDSLGEVYFANGKFAEAQKSFLAAYQTGATFLGGMDLLKASYAKWLAGDHDTADQTMKQFLIARVKQHDPLVTWREAVWLYATGRDNQARLSLEKSLADDDLPKEARDLTTKQLALWKNPGSFPKDPQGLKTLYDRTPPAQDGLIRTFYALALVETGQKEAARKLSQRWPLPESGGDPLYQAFLYPKFQELRNALK